MCRQDYQSIRKCEIRGWPGAGGIVDTTIPDIEKSRGGSILLGLAFLIWEAGQDDGEKVGSTWRIASTSHFGAVPTAISSSKCHHSLAPYPTRELTGLTPQKGIPLASNALGWSFPIKKLLQILVDSICSFQHVQVFIWYWNIEYKQRFLKLCKLPSLN